MARNLFRGDAAARADIFTLRINSMIPGARYGVRCWNRPLASVVAKRDESAAEVYDRLGAEITGASGLSFGLDEDIGAYVLTGPEGEALGARVDSSPGCYVENRTQGKAPVAKTIRITLPEGATGGTWGGVFNFGAGAEVLTGVSATASSATLKTAIAALATPTSSDLDVSLDGTSPRSWLVTFAGALAGVDVEVVSLDGSSLTGTAEVEISTVQEAAGNAVEVQALWFRGLMTTPYTTQLRFSRDGTNSSWVSINGFGYGTSSPAEIQAAVDSVVGVGVFSATYSLGYRGGLVVLRAVSSGAQGQVTISARGVYGTSVYTISSASETIRQAGANQNEFWIVDSGADDYDINLGLSTQTITSGSSPASAWSTLTGGATIHANSSIISPSVERNYLYIVEATGSNANTNLGTITIDNAVYTKIIDGEPLVNEIHQIIIKADSGTFTLSADDGANYTSALTYGLSAGTLQTALQGLAAIGSGNCTVTGSGTVESPYLVEFVSGKAATDVTELIATISSLVGGFDPTGATVTAAESGVQQVDQIYIDPNAIGGSILPAVDASPGNPVAWNGDSTDWTTGIEAVSGIGVTVTGAGSSFLVTFDDYARHTLTLDQTYLTVSASSLLELTQVQEATGPTFFNEPLNWTLAVVPGSGDTVVFLDGNRSCQQGLLQRCEFTADVASGDMVLGTGVDDCGHFVVGQAVYLSTSNTLPTATSGGSPITLSTSTVYYIRGIDRFNRRCQISTSASGNVIELTGAGTGTHEITVRWTKIEQMRAHTGEVGLPRRYGQSWEERPRFLKGEFGTVEIGLGTLGDGTPLFLLDGGTRVFSGEQWWSAQGDGEPAVQLRMTNTSTAYRLRGGQLGLGVDGVAATMGALTGQQSAVTLGTASLASLDLSTCSFVSLGGATVSGTIRNI